MLHGVISVADQGHPIGALEFADSHFPVAPPSNYGGRVSDRTHRGASENVLNSRPIFRFFGEALPKNGKIGREVITDLSQSDQRADGGDAVSERNLKVSSAQLVIHASLYSSALPNVLGIKTVSRGNRGCRSCSAIAEISNRLSDYTLEFVAHGEGSPDSSQRAQVGGA